MSPGEGFALPSSEQLDQVWADVRAALRTEVADMTFHIWLEPLELAGVDGPTLYVRAPDHVRTWVRDRYLPALVSAARHSHRPDATVEIVAASWEPTAGRTPSPVGGAASAAAPHEEPSRLIAKYTFEQFVIGRGNRFAHAAALAVAEQPAQAYNPLFIHGRPGLGKTHLLHAVGNYVERHDPGLRVRYATVEEFTTAFVTAVKGSGGMADFKRAFREIDLLLLDDVQFLIRKEKTEEELFHTFNALRDAGKQVVVTSDRPPHELEGLQERLGERMGSGLIVSLEAPDLGVRRAILAKRAHLDEIDADGELLEEIAAHVSTSVRALEAALIQVVAYASLRGEAPTPELARHLLRRISPDEPAACDVPDIVAASAAAFGVSPDEVMARGRRLPVARARKVAMYLTRELTERSTPDIGAAFGGRDHSTVLSAIQSVGEELHRDSELADTVQGLRQRLGTTT